MKTITAKVNTRLLAKADRLFTGTLSGRIIELLQNARRAGATRVDIRNDNGRVTVQDNGHGIEDFSKVLDMGASGWDEQTESAEDPAGVGLFCLAPRTVTVRSAGKRVTIDKEGWTGKPVAIEKTGADEPGTTIAFDGETWTFEEVERHAVFTGMDVTVDGKVCARELFLPPVAADYPQLGCRIGVLTFSELVSWQHSWRSRLDYANVLVNFHGQVVAFKYRPVDMWDLCFLVEMTGESTGIRLMLPARTCLVENSAFEELKQAMEIEAYKHFQRLGEHTLSYQEYQRAKELGIDLPEAKPTFDLGLLTSEESPDPIEVKMPKDFPLDRCCVLDPGRKDGDRTDNANAHLLAALGKFAEPFVPVGIDAKYRGYSWAQLPTIQGVRVCVGKELHADWLWSGKLVCVDSLTIRVETSDGRSWESAVCMALRPVTAETVRSWVDTEVLVTPAALDRLDPSEIWHHLGGYDIDGDSYDTQQFSFSRDLEAFWNALVGPDECLRLRMVEAANGIKGQWSAVRIEAQGRMVIEMPDGARKVVEAPTAADAADVAA